MEYSPHHAQLVCDLQRLSFVQEVKPELDIFHDPAFTSLHWTLDAEMKPYACSQ